MVRRWNDLVPVYEDDWCPVEFSGYIECSWQAVLCDAQNCYVKLIPEIDHFREAFSDTLRCAQSRFRSNPSDQVAASVLGHLGQFLPLSFGPTEILHCEMRGYYRVYADPIHFERITALAQAVRDDEDYVTTEVRVKEVTSYRIPVAQIDEGRVKTKLPSQFIIDVITRTLNVLRREKEPGYALGFSIDKIADATAHTELRLYSDSLRKYLPALTRAGLIRQVSRGRYAPSDAG